MGILLLHLVVYLLIGVAAGFLSGLLGVGGGIVVVPALLIVFRWLGIPAVNLMHVVAGTSLAIMVFTTFFSLKQHVRGKASILPVYRRLAPSLAIGAIVGGLLAHSLHSHWLEILLGIIMVLIGLRLLFEKQSIRFSEGLPNHLVVSCVGLLVGLKSGLLGLGGGIIMVPFLLGCQFPSKDVIGISAACSLTVALVGTVTLIYTGLHATALPSMSIGYVYLPALLGVAVIAPFFSRHGVMLSQRLSTRKFTQVFAIFLLFVGFYSLL